MALDPFGFDIRRRRAMPVYQRIAPEAALLHARGWRVSAIAGHFGIDHHTAAKALRWFGRQN